MIKEQKFTKVFRQYSRLVWKGTLRRTGEWTAAEEITQQVFLHYYEKMDSISDDFICPWLFLTAKNMVYDYFRKMQVRNVVCSLEEVSEKACSDSDNTVMIVERLAKKMLVTHILEELHKYKPEWYDVIEAACIRELSNEEGAEYLGIPGEIFRGRLYRARRYIRKRYGDEFAEL